MSVSLALALGVSMASAYNLTGLTDAVGSAIEITNDSSSNGNNISIIQDGNYNILTNSSTSPYTPIGNMRFYLGLSNGTSTYRINDIGATNEMHVLQINNTNTTFTSDTKGLKMGADGSGTLKFSFGSASNRSFALNLSNDDSSKYALYGNLEIENYDATSASTFNGTFGAKGIKGDIAFNGGNNITSTLVFNNGANIEGNVSAVRGTNTLTFSGDSTITGTIATSDDNTVSTTLSLRDGANITVNGAVTTSGTNSTTNINFDTLSDNAKTLTLGGSNNTITDITFGSTGTEASTNNTIVLSQGTTTFNKTDVVTIGPTIGETQTLAFTLNDGVTLNFAGGLKTNLTGKAAFNFGSSNNLNNTDTVTATITGKHSGGGTYVFNINAQKVDMRYDDDFGGTTYGTNEINFNNTNGATLYWKNSDGSALKDIYSYNGINRINFNQDGVIAGGVISDSCDTKITIADGKSGVIQGKLYGDLYVVFDSSSTGAKTLILESSGNNFDIRIYEASTKNFIVLKAGETRTSSSIASNQDLTFRLNTTVNLALSLTNSGVVNFDFIGSREKLTTGYNFNTIGTTNFNLGSSEDATRITGNIRASITGTGSAVAGTGNKVFNINTKNSTLQSGTNGLVFTEGTNEINFENTSGATLYWKNIDGNSLGNIKTIGGITKINFNQNGTIAGGIETENSKTTVAIADGKSGVIQGTFISAFGNGEINFDSSSTNTKTLTLDSGGNVITSITFGSGTEASTKNVLVLNADGTEIIDSINIINNQDLTFRLNNTANLTLSKGLTNSGEVIFDFIGKNTALIVSQAISTTGTTIFNLGSSTNINTDTENITTILGGSQSVIAGGGVKIFNVNAKNVTLKNEMGGLVFTEGTNEINFKNTNGGILAWQNNIGETQAISTTDGITNINFNNSGTILGGVSTSESGTTNINIKEGAYAIIQGEVTTTLVSTPQAPSQDDNLLRIASREVTNTGTQIDFTGAAGALVIEGANNSINNVNFANGNYFLSLTQAYGTGGNDIRDNRRSLTIESINKGKGSLTLVSQISKQTKDNSVIADTFVINAVTGENAGKLHLGVVLDKNTKMEEVGVNAPVRLASVKDTANNVFESSVNVVSGFTHGYAKITTGLTDENGENTNQNYTSYYIEKIANTEVIAAEEEITATAFTLNYDLYMANLNSLNKRMGELRENAHSQGVWARVFNGALSNNFGLESKSNYTTIQAGYDYAFGFEGANNYLGVALSYALSTSTSQNAFDSEGQKRGIDNVYSNAVEVALYNSYVSDSCWYNDTIAKFSYIMSKFDISNLNTGSVTNNDTTNFAFTLSDEVGYVFKLGENKEWSITPQIEVTFGYFNQSDFKQTLANSTAYLASSADAVLTLRTRVGSAFAYDLKNFTQKDSFNASLYVGAFYEYDYVSGGGITLSTDQINGVENILSDLSSDGRAVMNVGTNMSIKDNTRLYFDFEKSFGGKINTDYQVNFGVRYSFGESNGYTPMIEKAEFKAPLKVEGEEEKEENNEIKENKEEQESEKTQESKEAEKTTDKNSR